MKRVIIACLFCLGTILLAAQGNPQAPDTAFTQGADTSTCANFTYIHYRKSYILNTVEMTRACGPDRSHLVYDITELYDSNKRLLVRKENKEVIGSMGPAWPGRSYTDRELQADGTFSELRIWSPPVGGLECHVSTYNVTGVKTSDKVISIRQYNKLVDKRNKDRALLVKSEIHDPCYSAPYMSSIPFKGFGK